MSTLSHPKTYTPQNFDLTSLIYSTPVSVFSTATSRFHVSYLSGDSIISLMNSYSFSTIRLTFYLPRIVLLKFVCSSRRMRKSLTTTMALSYQGCWGV